MYRENIYEVMESIKEKESVLVIPKNTGLKGYAWKTLRETGLDLDDARVVGDGKLRLKGLTLLLRRGEDIPRVVMDEFRQGRIALGLTGDDLFDEFRSRQPGNTLKVENTYDWYDPEAKYLRPALCLIGQSADPKKIPKRPNLAINEKYKYTSRLYLAKDPQFQGKFISTTTYSGDLEGAVKSGARDYCIDTVYKGKTIRKLRLRVVGEPIRFTDLVVISALRAENSGLVEKMTNSIFSAEYLFINRDR